MAYPADTTKAAAPTPTLNSVVNLTVTNRRQKPDADEDLGSLKPRSHRALYPVIPDFDLNADFRFASSGASDLTNAAASIKDTPNKPVVGLKKPPPSPPTKARSLSPVRTNSARRGSTHTENSQGMSLSSHLSAHQEEQASQNKRRSSYSSAQTIPSDCSAEDLQAIQAALYEDDVHNDEYEEASMALVQQLIREELGLPPGGLAAQEAAAAAAAQANPEESSHSDASSIAPAEPEAAAASEEVRPEDTPEARASANTQDLIYQLCLQLDEVNIDVKSENWQVLAPHVINSLELFCYPTNTTSKCDEDNQCLVCLTDYEAGEQLRRLPCGHCFHQCCVDPWLMKHDICPICRKTIDEE